MAEQTLQEKIAILQSEITVLDTEIKQVTKTDYIDAENQIKGLKSELTVDDPSLTGIFNISVKAAELSRSMARAGEMYSTAIKNSTIWKDLLEKCDNMFEKFKNLLLIECPDVADKKNAGLQLAAATSHPDIKGIMQLCAMVKKEKSLAECYLLQCDQLINRIEFASKCLTHQIQSVDKQIQVGEVVKRDKPDERYFVKASKLAQ